MERFMKPDRLGIDPNSTDTEKTYNHWLRTFYNFVSTVDDNSIKLNLLINHIEPNVYEFISECDDFEQATSILESIYLKPKNEIFARHILSTRKQKPSESIDQFLNELKNLSKNCKFTAVNAEQYKSEMIRDAFINGLLSNVIRQRLLENKTLDFSSAFDQARSLDVAQQNSNLYSQPTIPISASIQEIKSSLQNQSMTDNHLAAIVKSKQLCWFCGNIRHPRTKCPAREAICHKCKKVGHFEKLCRSSSVSAAVPRIDDDYFCATISASANSPFRVCHNIIINEKYKAEALIDSGSTNKSFINNKLVALLNLDVIYEQSVIGMASASLSAKSDGYCYVSITLQNKIYNKVKLHVLDNLCIDIILGTDFQELHESITIKYGGKRPPLTFAALTTMKTEPAELFANLTKDCRPIATRSRNYSQRDKEFIKSEIHRLVQAGIIEPSNSPWRAQVLVVNEKTKRRMVVDYSETINKYTQLDAYPLPKIETIVSIISKYKIYSTLDLRSAYYQIPLSKKDRPYTAFEADNKLWQYTRTPFGVTNGSACFQRKIDNFVRTYKLTDCFPFIDNITICGNSQKEHDENLLKFRLAAIDAGITFNEEKCVFSTETLEFLGYRISYGSLKLYPQRLAPLIKLPPPDNAKSLQRIIGMFSYYAKWIRKFSDKIRPLNSVTQFPLNQQQISAFETLKNELVQSSMQTIDENIPFTVETDASDFAISATLNQDGRPVAFHSRTLQGSEQYYSSVEKEAQAIVEAINHWRHFLLGRHFILITDQRSVAFMYDYKSSSKIKNDKIMRWRITLSPYSYDIHYRPAQCNSGPDTFTRIRCATISSESLYDLHAALCHPGVTRLHHFIRSRNLPYSVEDVKQICKECRICKEVKPKYYRPNDVHLIKATQPFERISIDFKGPLPSSTPEQYMLTIVDEYSGFPFAYPVKDMTTQTIINCSADLFSMFGMPSYVHSDRGSSLMSSELKHWFLTKGIAASRTTPYNPTGNGQVERYNGIIWKSILLTL